MSITLAERIANLSVIHFSNLPAKYKPRTLPNGSREWTILSSIVLVQDANQPYEALKLISLATGTKCLTTSQVRKANGSVLHDSHAEILALRGANAWILREVRSLLEDGRSDVLECNEASQSGFGNYLEHDTREHCHPFTIKPNVSFYLYTSEAPCGDASMDLLISSKDVDDAVPWSLPCTATSASDQAVHGLHGRGYFSQLGVVRRKPSRPDAEPSMSKSCSDKIAVKQVTGLLAFPTDMFVSPSTESAGIKEMVVYKDKYNQEGYDRAFGKEGRMGRVERETQMAVSKFGFGYKQARYFEIMAVPERASRFEYEKRAKPISDYEEDKNGGIYEARASNISTVWICANGDGLPEILEILINGVKQGYKQFENRPGKESMLCRRRMWELGRNIADIMAKQRLATNLNAIAYDYTHFLSSTTYVDAKRDPSRERKSLIKMVVTSSLGNWIRNEGDDQWSLDR